MNVLNKKAVVIGGANGIGLAISHNLIKKGYKPVVLDLVEPKNIECEFHYFDMLDMDECLLKELAEDSSVDFLMVTAGIGRICSFEYLHPSEIQKLMTINSVSTIKIFSYFYNRIKSSKDFYTGVMGSIAGMISSPLFSVYAASKASIYRFVESVNIELEINNFSNRITNISPGSIKGTNFEGGSTELSLLNDLSNEIVDRVFEKNTLYIPNYEDVYKKVLNDYHENPTAYGIHSYNYKVNSNRLVNDKRAKIGYLSGTFDLFHIGHLNLIKRAKSKCDYLIVGVHKDASHKGKTTFIPYEERVEIVKSCKFVDRVVVSEKEDSDAVIKYGANMLFVGSDYKGTERFNNYEKLLKDKNVEIVYFPYTKGTSSTEIRNSISKNK